MILYDTTHYVPDEDIWEKYIDEDVREKYEQLAEIDEWSAKQFQQRELDVFRYEESNSDLECFNDLVETADDSPKNSGSLFVLYGTTGQWNGRGTIIPILFPTLKKAVDAALIHKYPYEAKVEETADGLRITIIHHDGTNYYYIRRVKSIGLLHEAVEAKFPDIDSYTDIDEAMESYIMLLGKVPSHWQNFVEEHTEPVLLTTSV